ncbi:MAG: YfiR family protein, partial [Sphingomonas sp.]|nr:YfiR family protein [Sphingomonas sp.]
GRRVTLHRLQSASGAERCHIAFIQGSRSQPAGQILAALARRPVLTVTDSRHGSQRGMIHFAVVGGRVRFSIDELAAANRGLAISSRLLTLAIGVRQR